MASQEASGTSSQGYQELIRIPASYTRILVEMAGCGAGDAELKGHVILGYCSPAGSTMVHAYQILPIWGNGLLFANFKPVWAQSTRQWCVAAQWRISGKAWYVYGDDA